MLLVGNDKSKIVKFNIFRKNAVRTHDTHIFTACYSFRNFIVDCHSDARMQQANSCFYIGEKFNKIIVMLLRQYFGGTHDNALVSRQIRVIHCRERYDCFAASDVAL